MISREFQFLLNCLRAQPDVGSVRNLVHKGLNWQSILEIAQRHGVRPLLRQGLKFTCWDDVPQSTRFDLESFNRASLQRNLSYTSELLRLLKLFEQNGIAVAAFKGPVLAQSVYGDLSLREFNDLDIMVHQADLHKAEEILIATGYAAQFPDADYRSTFVSYQGQYAFYSNRTGIWVDLHWKLSSKGVPFPIQTGEVWSRLRQVIIAGRAIPTLADDDLMLYLAAHGTKEAWRRLIWICDFTNLLRNCRDIDWVEVLDRSHRSYSSRPLLLAIDLASTLLGAPAPANLVDEARTNSAVRALSVKARARMLGTTTREEIGDFLNSLNTHDHFQHRLWLVISLLTTRTVGDFEAMRLPKLLWGIYYLTRPFRLAIKGVVMILKSTNQSEGGPGSGLARVEAGNAGNAK